MSTVPTGTCTAGFKTVPYVQVPETLEYYSCTIGLLHVRPTRTGPVQTSELDLVQIGYTHNNRRNHARRPEKPNPDRQTDRPRRSSKQQRRHKLTATATAQTGVDGFLDPHLT